MKDLWDLVITLEPEQQMVGVVTFSSMYSIITQLMVAGHSGHHYLVVQ